MSEDQKETTNFIHMKNKDIKELKEKIYEKNNGYCPLLNTYVPIEKMALDHIHKLKSDDISENKGVIRNTIEFRANAIEGKISNTWKRYFGADESKHPISLPDFLRNLADYLEVGAYTDGENNYYVHPTEVPKAQFISKQQYNKLKKVYKDKAKFPEFPKSKKLSKRLKDLFEKYDISPFLG